MSERATSPARDPAMAVTDHPGPASDRAVSPVVGVVALLAVTTALAAGAGVALQGAADESLHDPTRARLELSASADGRIALTHAGGDAVAVGDLRVVVAVDGERLARQPPVPFFAASGFESGPRGPFNVAHDGRWSAGETASFAVASTNSPTVSAGSRVAVRVYADGRLLFEGTAIAE